MASRSNRVEVPEAKAAMDRFKTEVASELGVKKRQAERVIAALKSKAGLKRRGADKNGEWYFESTRSSVSLASKSSKRLAKPMKERGEKEERTDLHKKGEV